MDDDNTTHSAVSWHNAVAQLDEDEWGGGQPGVTYGWCETTLLSLYADEARRLADVPEPTRHDHARRNVLAYVAGVHQRQHRWSAVTLRGAARAARLLPGGWAELGRQWLDATHPGFPLGAVRDLAAVGRYARRKEMEYVLPLGDAGPLWIFPVAVL